MGNIIADPGTNVSNDDSNDDDADVWYSLVEEVAAYLPPGVVMSWDSEQVKNMVLSISEIDTEQHWDLRAAHNIERRENLEDFPQSLAVKLMRVDPQLAPLRFRLVPARIKEREFWQQYFECIVNVITQHVTS